MTNVERKVPEKLLKGLADGTLTEWGGVIRKAAGQKGAGQIVAHLQFANQQVLTEVSKQLTTLTGLAQASVALSGLNLAVNIAGFAIVCHKLNKMSQQLTQLDAKLDKVLIGIEEIQWDRNWERHSKAMACFENLKRGLTLGRETTSEMALAEMTGLKVYHAGVVERLLADVRAIYSDPCPLQSVSEMALGLTLAQSQGWAHLGHLSEAEAMLREALTMHDNNRKRLFTPIEEKPPWLGRMKSDSEGVKTAREALSWYTQSQIGIQYSINQIEFCRKEGITLTELSNLTSDKEPMACILA